MAWICGCRQRRNRRKQEEDDFFDVLQSDNENDKQRNNNNMLGGIETSDDDDSRIENKLERNFNFASGHPSNSLIPVRATQQVFAKLASCGFEIKLANALMYGADAGDLELRKELAKFWNRQTKRDDLGNPEQQQQQLTTTSSSSISTKGSNPKSLHSTNADNFFITNGVSHGIDMLCSSQTQPGDVVLVERPTNPMIFEIFKNHGLVIENLPMKTTIRHLNKAEGIVDVHTLAEMLDRGEVTPPRMIYIVPTHQNPTGYTMPIDDRKVLVSIARRHGILVVADEVYHLLDWTPTTLQLRPARMAIVQSAVQTHDPYNNDQFFDDSEDDIQLQKGCCVTVSSFTKIFTPGLRCGWVEGPQDIITSLSSLGFIQSQGGCAPFVGEALRIALSDRVIDSTLKDIVRRCQQQCKALCDILSREPLLIQIATIPLGGYFIWIQLPCSAKALLQYCELHYNLVFLLGTSCEFSRNKDIDPLLFERFARLSFAHMTMEEIRSGAEQFISCVKEYIALCET